jgi:hypothetical protein
MITQAEQIRKLDKSCDLLLKQLDLLLISVNTPFWMDPDYKPVVWSEPPFTEEMRKARNKRRRTKPTLLDKYTQQN